MPLPIDKLVCGGQTGADRAALDFALASGIAYGGWVPHGRLDELGVIPARYSQLTECDSADPAVRTRFNVRDSDATLIVSYGALAGGSKLTAEVAVELGRPLLHLDLDALSEREAAARLASWLRAKGAAVLNVAGPRHSEDPRIYARVRAVLELAAAKG